MIEEKYEIDELAQEKRKQIIKELRSAIFELENDNLKLTKPKKDSEIEDEILHMIQRKASGL